MTREQTASVARGALVAAVGAALTYLSEWASNTDFGQWQPIVAAVLAVATNAVRKWAETPPPELPRVETR